MKVICLLISFFYFVNNLYAGLVPLSPTAFSPEKDLIYQARVIKSGSKSITISPALGEQLRRAQNIDFVKFSHAEDLEKLSNIQKLVKTYENPFKTYLCHCCPMEHHFGAVYLDGMPLSPNSHKIAQRYPEVLTNLANLSVGTVLKNFIFLVRTIVFPLSLEENKGQKPVIFTQPPACVLPKFSSEFGLNGQAQVIATYLDTFIQNFFSNPVASASLVSEDCLRIFQGGTYGIGVLLSPKASNIISTHKTDVNTPYPFCYKIRPNYYPDTFLNGPVEQVGILKYLNTRPKIMSPNSTIKETKAHKSADNFWNQPNCCNEIYITPLSFEEERLSEPTEIVGLFMLKTNRSPEAKEAREEALFAIAEHYGGLPVILLEPNHDSLSPKEGKVQGRVQQYEGYITQYQERKKATPLRSSLPKKIFTREELLLYKRDPSSRSL